MAAAIAGALIAVIAGGGSVIVTQQAPSRPRPLLASPVNGSPHLNPSASNAATSQPASTPASVVFDGSIAFGNYGIDLDANPPTNVAGSGEGSDTVFMDNDPPTIVSIDPSDIMVVWPGPSAPSQSACRQLTETHPLSNPITVRVGMQLCIYTSQYHTAYFKITGIDFTNGDVSGVVTVWSS
jgi:hypothetical protein